MQAYLSELLSGQDMRNSPAAISLKSSGALAQYETELVMLNFLAQKLASTDPSLAPATDRIEVAWVQRGSDTRSWLQVGFARL